MSTDIKCVPKILSRLIKSVCKVQGVMLYSYTVYSEGVRVAPKGQNSTPGSSRGNGTLVPNTKGTIGGEKSPIASNEKEKSRW